ncbi:MAG: ABC transporter permease, partial [Luteolibacter sp.]
MSDQPDYPIPVINNPSFSLLLARRYLNPRRAMLSSFTLISLVGVLLGVLVLVVVMAVYAGLERDVKARLLGFTPHVLIEYNPAGLGTVPMDSWQETLDLAATLPRVEAATAFVADNAIIDVSSWQRPIQFRGVDTSDPGQIDGLQRMLDMEQHPDSTADLGIDDRAVVSSTLAMQLGLQVGATFRLYSTRNFEEVMRAYKQTEQPPLRERFAESWERVKRDIDAAWFVAGPVHGITIDTLSTCYSELAEMQADDLRDAESSVLNQLMLALETN